MSSSNEFCVIYVTVPDENAAARVTESVVDSKLVACVNAIPGIKSTYLWKGQVTTDQEILLMMKTRTELFDRLQETIKTQHPYETPEIISVPITNGIQSYLDWIRDSTLSST